MLLSNDLFNVENIVQEEGIISAALLINSNSDILKGHFPGHPVVPGASMLQIVKEVLESSLGKSLQLKKAAHLKFMSLIEPSNIGTVQLDITYKFPVDDTIDISAKISVGDLICFKFQGSFILQ